MIRFEPDTLREALWRPIAMAVPNAGVYVETMAPDLRFAVLLVLTLVLLALAWTRIGLRRPVWLLVAFVWLAFVPWLATSGNGRYFCAVLLLAGPLCIGLVYHLPLSRRFRLFLAATMLVAQSLAVSDTLVGARWGLVDWGETYFDIALDSEQRHQPATYVTLSSISYSLLAPQFDPRSHWINLASLAGDPDNSLDDRRAARFLAAAAREFPLRLVVPSLLSYTDANGQPVAALRSEMNRTLSPHLMSLAPDVDCKLARSASLAALTLGSFSRASDSKARRLGFWICPITYPVAREVQAAVPVTPGAAQAERVFARLEQVCPRLFVPGSTKTARLPDGFSRSYGQSDTKVYVLDDGSVMFKYWRALNPQDLGKVDTVLSEGFALDCHNVHGRSGLPWERHF